MDDHISDMKAALQFVRKQHRSTTTPPIVCGHSFGGGYLQYLLSQEGKVQGKKEPRLVSGLILLGSAPIWGGARQIMDNWERVETDGKGYAYPWSPRTQLDTAKHVRGAFFRGATDEDAIERWRTTCRTEAEGLRTGLSAFWPFGAASEVLAAIEDIKSDERGRKLLCVTAECDPLVTVEMVTQNAKAYLEALTGGQAQTVMQTVIHDCGHHMMMDTPWKRCADEIIKWSEM